MSENVESAPSGEQCFWKTQPIGTIEQHIQLPVKQEPCKLPDLFEWVNCDIMNDQNCMNVYELLKDNYVEDGEGLFRFNYSEQLLKWALCPLDYSKSWHIGLQAKNSKKLVAFIGGVPLRIRIGDQDVKMAAINFMCVHKNFRSKGLVPILIKEMTRRVQLKNYQHATFTSGTFLETPLTSCQYWHRSLNHDILFEVGFAKLGPRDTLQRAAEYYCLPDAPTTSGFRKMKRSDIGSVNQLLISHLSQYSVAPLFDRCDVKHWFLPKKNVVHAYVVESPTTHEITDFCSFYELSLSVLDHSQGYTELKAACSYYNVALTTPVSQLMEDALVVAKKEGYDVFNALNIMGNQSFLKDLNFVPGDGTLHYYLYNYCTPNAFKPSELGLVLPSCVSSQYAMSVVLSDSTSDEYVDEANEDADFDSPLREFEVDLPSMMFTWRTVWYWYTGIKTRRVFPHTLNQGLEDNCVPMAIYASMTAQIRLSAKNKSYPTLSLQHLLSISLGLEHRGRHVGSLLELISREGIVSADDYPFRHRSQVKRYYVDLKETLVKNDPEFAEKIIKVLRSRPVIAGFEVDDTYGKTEGEYLFAPNGPRNSGHAVTLTGWREDEDEPVEIVEYLNSYGKKFGDNGYGGLKIKDILIVWDVVLRPWY